MHVYFVRTVSVHTTSISIMQVRRAVIIFFYNDTVPESLVTYHVRTCTCHVREIQYIRCMGGQMDSFFNGSSIPN